ncbi:amidohydrolase family protein [Solimonas terrae]|uniref:Amidohydrolase family protein n=1 Tax=Solimonas terrae TaxID=1396819 RepID=A0A6M2BV46_9GAMM|nr:amidohydrolase family protein [Solimonas terrae]NGY06230.1 amidohydrolase family protein [Solimonas terrae]
MAISRLRSIAALTLAALPALAAFAQPAALAITHVTVIDGRGGPQTDMSVLLQGGRIAAVTPAKTLHLLAGTQLVDGRGRFLIPGLWDMHVHLMRPGRVETYFPLLIANGITGVRDMGGELPLAEIGRLKREVEDGTRLGPHLFAAGPLVDGPYPVLPHLSRVVTDAASAEATVVELHAQGADFIKVYNRLPRDAYFAIADTTRRLGMPFAGHVPFSVSAREASDAGQKSIEHLFNVLFACSSREDGLMREKAAMLASSDADERRRLRRDYLRGVLDSYDPQKADALFARFARNGTWQVPTLVQRRFFAQPDPAIAGDPRLRYIQRSQRIRWDPRQDGRIQNRDAEDREIEQRSYEMDRAMIPAMLRAGVRFLAGTDSPDPYAWPGFGLHDELAALVDAGLTPMQALQAATRNAAEYLGLQNETGAIAPGLRADLVLLDADPLADIRNTRRIEAVIFGGHLLSSLALQQLRDQAAAAADRN